MIKNVGKVDRYTRITFGIAAIGAGLFFQSWWGSLGLVPLVTEFIRWCPAYSINIGIAALLIGGRIFMAEQVRYGYPTKTDPTQTWVYLPYSAKQ